MNIILIIVYFMLIVYNCEMYGDEFKKNRSQNTNSFINKILATKKITITDTNFSSMSNDDQKIISLYAEFDILYITDSVIYKLSTFNEIFKDSIDIIESVSKFKAFKILSNTHTYFTYSRDSNGTTSDTIIIDVKNRSILMENTEFVVKKNVRVESVDQFKSWVDDFVHKRKSSKGLNIDNLCPADE